jgi:hypothetical protein
MRELNFYSFHKGIAEHRFDHGNSLSLEEELSKYYKVSRLEYEGNGRTLFQGVPIDHGSILIFEYKDTGEFKVFDFGDRPNLTYKLSQLNTFRGAVLGQYNPHYWDSLNLPQSIRNTIAGGIYPETVWQLGELNYQAVQEYRSSVQLSKKLHWRGSLYTVGVPDHYLGIRKSVELLPNYLTQEQLNLQGAPTSFDQYIQEALNFKLVLSIGGGGGALCGDFCFRDIEMFGLGIPLIRPRYIVETANPLIPDFHYISVDCEFDQEYRYKDHEQLSKRIAERYLEVIENTDLLTEVATNAKKWYTDNIVSPNITLNLINTLGL